MFNLNLMQFQYCVILRMNKYYFLIFFCIVLNQNWTAAYSKWYHPQVPIILTWGTWGRHWVTPQRGCDGEPSRTSTSPSSWCTLSPRPCFTYSSKTTYWPSSISYRPWRLSLLRGLPTGNLGSSSTSASWDSSVNNV